MGSLRTDKDYSTAGDRTYLEYLGVHRMSLTLGNGISVPISRTITCHKQSKRGRIWSNGICIYKYSASGAAKRPQVATLAENYATATGIPPNSVEYLNFIRRERRCYMACYIVDTT